MPDSLSSTQRHNCMSHIRSKDTKPEVKLRKALFRLGYRYRINDRRFAGTPDIVLPKYHTCIFVNGCFWHAHKGCRKYVQPKSNSEFWETKFSNNRERDLRNYRDLEALGWRVIVVWECELANDAMDGTTARVRQKLDENRQCWFEETAERRKRSEEWRNEIRRRKEFEKKMLEELKH